MTGTKWSDIRKKPITNKQLRERLDTIESFDEIYNHRCLNWNIKLAVMPATESENRPPKTPWYLVLHWQSSSRLPTGIPVTPTLIY